MKIKDETPEELEDDKDINVDVEDRKRDYSRLKAVEEQLAKIYPTIEKAYEDKLEQSQIIEDCWDIYNCELSPNQKFSGEHEVFIPIVRDAMNSRKTRFVNTLFPSNGRYADIVSSNGKTPSDLIALMDYYVKTTNLRTDIAPSLIRSGDITGNYSLLIEWSERSRHIVVKDRRAELETEQGPIEGSEEYDDVKYEELKDECPVVSVIDSRDLVILPVSVNNIRDAEVVCIALRYTEANIRDAIKEGVFEKDTAEVLIRNMSSAKGANNQVDTGKKNAAAAGVKTDSDGNKKALIYQVWTRLKIKGERRMMVAHFGGPDLYLGCKRNPYWNDRVPVIHRPVEKRDNCIWGESQVAPVRELQYAANDAVNMGMDSAQYSLLPIVITDPEKNPNVGSMILSMASIWLADPNSTKFASMPTLWKDAFSIVGSCKEQIMQSLSVNPAMIPMGNQHKKPSQSEVAQAQQVALESTNDEVTILEDVFSQLLEWFYDLDYQYRTRDITVKKFGELGIQATMDMVQPFQVKEQYTFRWFGLESFKAAQQVQQMISWTNVLTKLPPQALNGRKVDIGPILEYVTEVTCGPRIAPHVLVDQRHQMTVNPALENEMLDNKFPVQTHPTDDDTMHLEVHMQSFREMPNEFKRGHILEHIKQMKEKVAAQQMQQAGPPQQGGPRPGAQNQAPTGVQNPPGAVHPDNMPTAMPRK